ncbi:MAG: hypothetical protein GEV03_24455 [Streptosporangiales bacterium]|nr:hypothetical protein [Streptosporangiales bacterium]
MSPGGSTLRRQHPTVKEGSHGGHGALDWVFELTDHSSAGDEVIRTTGAILAGRRTYDGTRKPRHEPYGGAWSGPIFVLTHRPADDPTVTARQCLQQGLVDEILIHLVPVLLGDGVRLFDVPDTERVRLERIGCAESGQLTDLRFRPTNPGRRP